MTTNPAEGEAIKLPTEITEVKNERSVKSENPEGRNIENIDSKSVAARHQEQLVEEGVSANIMSTGDKEAVVPKTTSKPTSKTTNKKKKVNSS